MNNTPYIGVTDFTSYAQVKNVKELIPPWVDRRLHVGAMISYKTLNEIPTSTGWEKIWLNEKGLRDLFVDDKEVFNVIHYADYPDETHKVLSKSSDVLRAVKKAGPHVNGIQLDMVWPNGKIIADLKEWKPDLQVIMQVSSKAIEFATNHELNIVQVLECYNLDYIDYVLVDFGMGRGTPFNPTVALDLVEQVLLLMPQKKVAVAGGLGPETFANLKPIFSKYPEISCDAQGQLRPSGSAKDPLDMQRVASYISGVCSLLN